MCSLIGKLTIIVLLAGFASADQTTASQRRSNLLKKARLQKKDDADYAKKEKFINDLNDEDLKYYDIKYAEIVVWDPAQMRDKGNNGNGNAGGNGNGNGKGRRLMAVQSSPAESTDTQMAAQCTTHALDIMGITQLQYSSNGIPLLRSKPGSTNVVVLDFDGTTVPAGAWRTSGQIVTNVADQRADSWRTTGQIVSKPYFTFPLSLADQQKVISIWCIMQEDYAPFDVDITTVDTYTPGPRVGRVAFTDELDVSGVQVSSCAPGQCGGVAYVGVFGASNYAYYQPAWVFPVGDMSADAAEAASHELGHNMGLGHDGTSTQGYYSGATGTNWAPIMGVGYYKPLVQFSRGVYPDANNQQDDMQILTNVLGVVADEASACQAITLNTPKKGFINRLSSSLVDDDCFTVTVPAGTNNLLVTASPLVSSKIANVKLGLQVQYGAVTYREALACEPNLLEVKMLIVASFPAATVVTVTVFPAPVTGVFDNYANVGRYTVTVTSNPGTPSVPSCAPPTTPSTSPTTSLSPSRSPSTSPSRSFTSPSLSPSRSPSTSPSRSPSTSPSRSPPTSPSTSPSRSPITKTATPTPSRSVTSATRTATPTATRTTSPTPSRSVTSASPTATRTATATTSPTPTRSPTPSRSITSASPTTSPTPSKAPKTGVLIYIDPDYYPQETSWSLTQLSASLVLVASGGPLQTTAEQYKFLYLSPGQYDFRIDDSANDGICCGYGHGIYRLFVGPTEVANGGQFLSSETKALQVTPNAFACGGREIWLVMRTDGYPGETSWSMTDQTTNQQVMAVASNTIYRNVDSVYVSQICAQPGRSYVLVMMDSFGDGLLPGGYQVVDVDKSTVLVAGGNFTFEQTAVFLVQ
eukprot:g5401.t1